VFTALEKRWAEFAAARPVLAAAVAVVALLMFGGEQSKAGE